MSSKIWQDQIVRSAITELSRDIHNWAVSKGFWDEERNDAECIALMHSELSEALEGLRKPHRDEHCPEFDNVEIELADCVIRIMDFSHKRGYRLASAIEAKMDYNETRPRKHGKKF